MLGFHGLFVFQQRMTMLDMMVGCLLPDVICSRVSHMGPYDLSLSAASYCCLCLQLHHVEIFQIFSLLYENCFSCSMSLIILCSLSGLYPSVRELLFLGKLTKIYDICEHIYKNLQRKRCAGNWQWAAGDRGYRLVLNLRHKQREGSRQWADAAVGKEEGARGPPR
jgi:hypothetical protein